MQLTQDGLYLLHTIMNLLHGFRKISNESKYPNYYVNVINNLKCLYDIQGVLGGYLSNNY